MKWTRGIRCLVHQLSWIAVLACPPPAGDDAGAPDAAVADAAVADIAVAEAGRIDSSACTVDPHGFCIRTPQTRAVPSEPLRPGTDGGTTSILDIDHLCTLDFASLSGHVYVQARAVYRSDCCGCDTTVDGAWISVGGSVSPVAASYSWGGNHGNDSILVSYDDKVFKYYHSSFSSGWHACQPPDCIQVFRLDGTTLIEDGCTHARTQPQVCVRVNADGSVPPLVDTFELCPGDVRDGGAGG